MVSSGLLFRRKKTINIINLCSIYTAPQVTMVEKMSRVINQFHSKKKLAILITVLLVSTLLSFQSVTSVENEMTLHDHIRSKNKDKIASSTLTDLDPLVDIHVTVAIKEIRALDEIDIHSDPDFYVKVFINDDQYTSPVWKNQKYITDPQWSCTSNVPDDEEFVWITIQLWDWNIGLDTLCDIAANDNSNADRKDLTVLYSIKTGHWYGDDMVYIPHSWYMDLSGYGRGNGCDDNSIYIKDNDCEIWFDITQNDYDGDGIPYWTETEIYHTDPTVDDRGLIGSMMKKPNNGNQSIDGSTTPSYGMII